MASLTEQEKKSLGVVIAEKYRVDKLIARGGFSSVYRGTQMGMGRPVAIKILALDQDVEATWLERFGREARLVSQLRHPNTITIFDFGKHEDEFLYIVMEYINGRSLSRQVRKYGSLSPQDVTFVATEILKSLDEAHARGILHRDLKPSNIMIARDHNDQLIVKVLDFGVAKIMEADETEISLTAQGAFVGTPRYASPEQMRREEATPRSDIYGVGMIMWEALVGDPPVPDTEFSTAVEYHLGPQPWKLPPEVACPPALAHVLYRALEKDPRNRYANCSEMLSDLRAMMDGSEDDSYEAVPGALREVFDSISEVEDVDPKEETGRTPGFDESGSDWDWQPETQFDPEEPEPVAADNESIRAKVAADNRDRMRRANPSDDLDFKWEDELTREHDKERKSPQKRRPDRPEADEVAPGLAVDPRAVPSRREERRDAPERPKKERPILMWAIVGMIGGVILLGGIGVAVQSMTADEPSGPMAQPEAQNSNETQEEPLIPTEKIISAMRAAGWLTSGKINRTELGATVQTSMIVDYTRKEMVANVVIYECESDQLADEISSSTDSTSEVVRFGRTVVKVSTGPSNKVSGVATLTEMLFTFRQMMQKKGLL